MVYPAFEIVQPGEKKAISFNYSSAADRPSASVNVTAGTWTLIDLATQENVTVSKMGTATATVVSNKVSGTVDNLEGNKDYLLTLVYTLSDNQELEDELKILCRNV